MAHRLSSTLTVLGGRIFNAWGNGAETVTPPQTDPWGFNSKWGYYYDRESQLYLCQHRMYDASTGRFLNRDPIGYAGGLNLYGYCGGGPVGSADPSGTAAVAAAPIIAVGAIAVRAGLAAYVINPSIRESVNQAIEDISAAIQHNRCEPIDVSKPGRTGAPGSSERGWNTSRRYLPTGYPQVDRDWDPTHKNPDHSHDWIPDPDGGFPTRGPRGNPSQGTLRSRETLPRPKLMGSRIRACFMILPAWRVNWRAAAG